MIRWIITQSLKFRFLMVAVGGALMIVGAGQVGRMPIDVFPEFAPPRVEIQTPCLGLVGRRDRGPRHDSAGAGPQGVPGLDDAPLQVGLAAVVDRADLRQWHRPDRRASAGPTSGCRPSCPSLPTWAAPPFILQPLSATSRVMKIGLSSDTVSLIDMSMIAVLEHPRPAAARARRGQRGDLGRAPKMYQVQVDPERLQAQRRHARRGHGGDRRDAGRRAAAVHRTARVVGTGGFVDTPNQRLAVRHVLPIVDAGGSRRRSWSTRPQIGGTRTAARGRRRGGRDHQPLIGDAVINDGPGLMLIVEKLPWANTLDVTEGVEEAIDELAPGMSGIEVDTTIFRPATFVELAMDNLTQSLMLGCLLVVADPGALPVQLAQRRWSAS